MKERHHTPYLKKRALHTAEAPANEAEEIAKEISESFGAAHADWYADFKNGEFHCIIFPDKVFVVERPNKNNTERLWHTLTNEVRGVLRLLDS